MVTVNGNAKADRQSWLLSLKVSDIVRIKGWGGIPLGTGIVTRVGDDIMVRYPDGICFSFTLREGVGCHRDNFDLIEPLSDWSHDETVPA